MNPRIEISCQRGVSLNMRAWVHFTVFRCLTWRGRLLASLERLLLSVTVFNVVFGPRCVGDGMPCESDSGMPSFGIVEAPNRDPCMWNLVPSGAISTTRILFVIISAVRDR